MAPVPLLVINVKPQEFLADYQGTYSAGATYQKGQIVQTAGSNFWSCLAVSKGNTPEEGSAFWGFLGNIEAVVTKAQVETAEAKAKSEVESAESLGAYSGKTERETGKEIEESAVRRTLVTLTIETKTATRTLVEVQVNKAFAGMVGCSVTDVGKGELSITFAVAAKQKWECKVIEGAVEKLYSSSVTF